MAQRRKNKDERREAYRRKTEYRRKWNPRRYLIRSMVIVFCAMAVGMAVRGGGLLSEPGWRQILAAGETMNAGSSGTITALDSSMSEWESESESEFASEFWSGNGAQSESTPESESNPQSESSPESESNPQSESSPESESNPQSESSPESESNPQSESTPESESNSQSESDPQSESTSESESNPQSESSPESESNPQSESSPESESNPQSESSPESESNPQSESTPESESNPQSESGPESESNPQSESNNESENIGESETEAISESETEFTSEPATETMPGPETEFAPEPETEFVPEPETEIAPEPETELAPEPETEIVPEPETEFVPEPEKDLETEKTLEKVRRGEHYEVVGDQGAWYRDLSDRLWVRPGTSLYIRTVEAGGFSEGAGKADIVEDGTLVFSLKKVDQNGMILRESELVKEAYFVDGEVPQAEITVNGITENGICYAAQATKAAVMVAPDGKSGLKAAAYTVLPCSEDGTLQGSTDTASWTSCGSGDQIAISGEGIFRVFVRTEDQVGNVAFSQSSLVCVDRKPPEVSIEGVGDQTANSGAVKILVTAEDAHYKAGSMKVEISGVNGKKIPAVKSREETAKGAQAEYFDIPRQREYDDVYQMRVQAEDTAGNVAGREIEFSVNRFGSVYDLAGTTKQSLKQYYLSKAEDVTFYETNIDYVGESAIYCRRDGALVELERGQDYQVTMQGSKDSWKQYQYTIPASYFSKEGVYELMLSSEDAADNKSDTGIQEKRVTFVLDWTIPGCTLTGIEQQVYQGKEITAYLTPYDNMELKTLRVYHNSELFMEETSKESLGKTMTIPLAASDDWQTLQVYLCDMAGNEYWTEETPVYISAQTKQVPLYVKTKPSAREKLLQMKERSLIGEKTDAVELGQNQRQEEAPASEVLKTRKAELGSDTASEDETFHWKKMEGIVLLMLGLVMFASTIAAYALSGLRKKK